jgi:hypothetical protein
LNVWVMVEGVMKGVGEVGTSSLKGRRCRVLPQAKACDFSFKGRGDPIAPVVTSKRICVIEGSAHEGALKKT